MFFTFIKYSVAGGTAFLFDFSLVYFLLTQQAFHYTTAVVCGFIFGTLINYTINRLWGFKNTTRTVLKGYIYFLQIALIGLLMTLGLMVYLVEILHMHELLARALTAGIVLVWSFIANMFFTFRKRKITS